MKSLLKCLVAAVLPLAACNSYPKGADRYTLDAQTSYLSQDAPKPPPPAYVAPARSYKSATVYPAPPWRVMDVLPSPVVVDEPTRRCGAQRGNSVYEFTYPNEGSFEYKYLNTHREGVRGTMDWMVDGVLSDWPHYVNVRKYGLPYAPRTTETQFFRAYERHDLCLSGKPNAMAGSRARCDAEFNDDIDQTCRLIYGIGYGRFDCGIRATYVKFAVSGVGGMLDKSNELYNPRDNIYAACSTYRGWTAPVDQVLKLRSRVSDDGTVQSALLRITADRAAGRLYLMRTTPEGGGRTFAIALPASTRVCRKADTRQIGLDVVYCDDTAWRLDQLDVALTDFLMLKPVAADFNGDGRDEVVLLAAAGMKKDLALGAPGQALVSLVALPIAFDGDTPVVGDAFVVASFRTDPLVPNPREVRDRFLSLISERVLAGSFLIDDRHHITRGSTDIRPQQLVLSAVTPVVLDSSKTGQVLDLRTLGFAMAPDCAAGAACFRQAIMTRTQLFKDGRIDAFGDVQDKIPLANIEIYKRLSYPADRISRSLTDGGGDAVAFYYAGSGLRSGELWLPQYMERSLIGPAEVGDVFAIDLSQDGDAWYSQAAGDEPTSPCKHDRADVAGVVRQINWFHCRTAADPAPAGTHSDFRHWSKLLYPAVPMAGTTKRYAAFLTNCDVIDESRAHCARTRDEFIRLAVIDESQASRVTPQSDRKNFPGFETPPGQLTLVDIHNRDRWTQTGKDDKKNFHDKKARSCAPKARGLEVACEWFELPSYTGRFGPDGKPAFLFVKKETEDKGEANTLLRALTGISLLAVYDDGKAWAVTEYHCPQPDAAILGGEKSFWLASSNAMVMPDAGPFDNLVFPLPPQKTDSGPQARWVQLSLGGGDVPASSSVSRIRCMPVTPKAAAQWEVSVTRHVQPWPADRHHDWGFALEPNEPASRTLPQTAPLTGQTRP